MQLPLAPDPIRVQSCVCCLFWTNCIAVTSIFLSSHPIRNMNPLIDANSKWKFYFNWNYSALPGSIKIRSALPGSIKIRSAIPGSIKIRSALPGSIQIRSALPGTFKINKLIWNIQWDQKKLWNRKAGFMNSNLYIWYC